MANATESRQAVLQGEWDQDSGWPQGEKQFEIEVDCFFKSYLCMVVVMQY